MGKYLSKTNNKDTRTASLEINLVFIVDFEQIFRQLSFRICFGRFIKKHTMGKKLFKVNNEDTRISIANFEQLSSYKRKANILPRDAYRAQTSTMKTYQSSTMKLFYENN